jgi:O-antigen biosynthesis protein
MTNPAGWRSMARGKVDAVAPEGTPRRRVLRAALEASREARDAGAAVADFWRREAVSHRTTFDYSTWLDAHRTPVVELEQMSRPSPAGSSFEVTVAVLAGPGDAAATFESLHHQVRPATTVEDRRHHEGDVWAQWAAVLDAAPQDRFVLALFAGDRLEPDAIARILDRAHADPRAQVLTWDDDVGAHRQERDPLFRPMTFSPDMLWSANPFGRSLAVRAGRASSAGGLRAEFGDDAVWDLLLRMGLQQHEVVHLPRVLGHLATRPAAAGPVATRVVSEHLRRSGLEGSAEFRHGAVRVRWEPQRRPPVSLLVPTRHNRELIGPLLDSLRSTAYPDWEIVVVDNGGRSEENERFYVERADGLDHRVIWWDRPFNFGAVNNAAAQVARGEILVLLNDDTVIRSPEWLEELVGWLAVPGVGTVGVQMLDPEGRIQHGGAIIGAAGLADHRFQGMEPHSDTIIGSTDWYRDSVANTAACVALRRSLWEDIGGLDERFVLCGSDVVLGLDTRRRGLRNVITPAIHVDHMESATRRTEVPTSDIFASYWRYARPLRAGDPYHNPNVSLISRVPALRAPDEPSALDRVGPALGRGFGGAFAQTASQAEAYRFGDECRVDDRTVGDIRTLHSTNAAAFDVRSVNWFVPSFDNPFYGGLATIFRIADHLRRHHGVENRFVVWGPPNERWVRSALSAVFPGLEESEVIFAPDVRASSVRDVPYADASIATQWQTAYQVAHFAHTRRKHYLIQDFEPMFNPAGTLYALAEETYRLGLIGLCNTPHLLEVYQQRYGGSGTSFVPAVDPEVFHAQGRRDDGTGPVEVFVYARPGHWRNCWELLEPALHTVKGRFGKDVRIVTAGAWSSPRDLADGIDHLGLLDYEETGPLYRSCDVGVSLTVSEHPSYLPLELMACGVPVVAFDLPAGYWILDHDRNSLLARRTVDSLVDRISHLVENGEVRARLRSGAVESIASAHYSWEENLSGIHAALGAELGPPPHRSPSGGVTGADAVRSAAAGPDN